MRFNQTLKKTMTKEQKKQLTEKGYFYPKEKNICKCGNPTMPESEFCKECI